jgi:hypothetical protein
MPTIKKDSAALGKPRPRPRPKVSLAKRESEVAATPSPPQCDMRDPTPAERYSPLSPSLHFFLADRVISVLYISDSAEEIVPQVRKMFVVDFYNIVALN